MSLETGMRLGRLEILGLLGAGGMGEVYRARDPELARDVAVKVLPTDVADDTQRVKRMETEAKAVGRLNHPNLLAIHDIGRHQGTLYLVYELLEGNTLRERLGSRRLSPDEVLIYGAQIAAGLAAAHDEGVVHRDLKPENLFVTRDGRVKILDFGLAKLVGPLADDQSMSPTLSALTAHGSVLGTVAYMSPEQAAGRLTDHHSDQFALGTILHEMLAGRHPFERETAPQTMTAILEEEPEPLTSLTASPPPPLRWIVERCLEKQPEDRYASTRDLARDLQLLGDRLGDLEHRAEPPARVRRTASLLVLLAILLVAGSALVAFLVGREGGGARGLRFDRITFRRGTVNGARFDQDGESVLYSAAWEGKPSRLYLKRPGTPEPIVVGPQDSVLQAVSSRRELLLTFDHHSVGPFVRAGTLGRMPLIGTPRVLDQDISQAVWGPDGEVLAQVRQLEQEAVLEFPPGQRRLATGGMIGHLRASTDGRRIAFVEFGQRGANVGSIVVADAGGGERRLGRSGNLQGLDWSPDEKEIWFAREASIIAADEEGEERVVATFPQRIVLFDATSDGRVLLAVEPARWGMVGRAPGAAAEQDLTWLFWSVPFAISRDGKVVLFNECPTVGVCTIGLRGFDEEPPVLLGDGFALGLSPDGTQVLSVPPWRPTELTLVPTGPGDRQTFDLAAAGIERANLGSWSPDGEQILLNADTGESTHLFRFDPATGRAELITPEELRFGFFAISPDSQSVAVQLAAGDTVIYPLEGGKPVPIPDLDEQPIQWSSDGRFLFTFSFGQMPLEIHRVAVTTGARETFATLVPADPAGTVQISPVAINPQGDAYVYGHLQHLSELLVVEGLE